MAFSTRFLICVSALLSALASAATIDCDLIVLDNKRFKLDQLKGPHGVLNSKELPPSVHNTTWTINPCGPLKKVKDIPNADQCPAGTYVCGIDYSWNPTDDPDQEKVQLDKVIPIAGNYETSSGGRLDPTWTRLKATDANTDGLQLEIYGGKYNGKKQKAVIEFQCDKTRTGNEGNIYDLESKADDDNETVTPSLQFVSYARVEGKEAVDVLRLDWKTKYACEDFEEDVGDGKKKASWGFFTWFILIAFLAIAAYLTFGSWLNYNRYGARGWDLLPHGDTIRDIPYLFKDWARKVIDTVSGGGTRGGYSAV